MKRSILSHLLEWKEDSRRKPLLIRGARQVGKTFVIRQLGKKFRDFQEINFELKPGAGKAFDQDLGKGTGNEELKSDLKIRKKILT